MPASIFLLFSATLIISYMMEFTAMKSGVYTSTKVIVLGSCAFRQWKAAANRPGAGANSARCSRIHGYNLKAKFHFRATELDERNWVLDFGALKGLKTLLEAQFDHTLCIAQDDPCLPLFKQLHDAGACDLRVMTAVGIEKAAEYCFQVANQFVKNQTSGRAWCTLVEVWEHENNSATYGNETALSYSSSVNPSSSVTLLNEVQLTERLVPDGPNSAIPFTPIPGPTNVISIPVAPEPATPTVDPRSAKVGTVATPGFSNLFAGTSWGRK